MTKYFYSNGKLLLTGEYAVLDGATSLAIPTRYGQSLEVTSNNTPQIIWKSLDENAVVWFETGIEIGSLAQGAGVYATNTIEGRIRDILAQAVSLNPAFLSDERGFQVISKMDFPRDWGLGSSSTLINNIAQWAGIDAYQLLWNTFSGSGYDIACAQHNSPILYSVAARIPQVTEVNFDPPFKNNLFFIYLNKKQDTREGIDQYSNLKFDRPRLIGALSEISGRVLSCQTLDNFEKLMDQHERLLSNVLKLPTVKESLFPDFKGTIKSLGAWGGDFVLATGQSDTAAYFKEKGYDVVIPFSKMILYPTPEE